jgi:hypothetical protein
MEADLPPFGDPEVARALKSELGVGELERLKALMSGTRLCRAHPSSGHEAEQCPCRTSPAEQDRLDAAEERQRARDDADSGLSYEQRTSLLGGLAAMFAGGARARLGGEG